MAMSWTWREDRQWSTGRFLKHWNGPKWFADANTTDSRLTFELEVRTEDHGNGSQRLGEMFITCDAVGSPTGMRLKEEETA